MRSLFHVAQITLTCSLLFLPGSASLGQAHPGPQHPEWRALLASPGMEGQPVKGVYFFPGEAAGNLNLYTSCFR